MRYIFIALTMGLLAGSAFSNEQINDTVDQATIDQAANSANDNLDLKDGKSSSWGWWNLGYYRNYGYGYGLGYGSGYGYYGCGRSYPAYYSACGGGYPYYSWGFYNPNYLYRVAPMVR